MKVFISWSGEPSRSIARALKGWLETVVQHVDAWMSDDDIQSGARWNEAIAEQLDQTDFGIVCVTRDNQAAPWVIFEAGALAKIVEKGRVAPLRIDLLSSDLTGPLTAFQGRQLDEDGVMRLVNDLNEAAEKKMPKEQLDSIFMAMWPRLETAINDALEGVSPPEEPERSMPHMVAEVVETVRRIERSVSRGSSALSTGDLSRWLEHFRTLRTADIGEDFRLVGPAIGDEPGTVWIIQTKRRVSPPSELPEGESEPE